MSESRAKNSAYNMISGFAYQALMLILGFVSRTIFLQTLGKEYLGLNGIFQDVLNLLSMADLGFNTAMAYSFYKPLAEHDEKQLASLVHFYKKIYNIIAIAVAVIGLCCVPFLRYIVNTEKDIPNLEIYYICALAGVVISYLYVYKTTILTADQKNYKIANINIVTSLLKTITQIAILVLFKNYIAYLVIGIAFQYLANMLASKKAESTYPYINDKSNLEAIDKEVSSGIWKNMKSVFIYKLSGTLFNATDNIIISVVVGTATVGLYSNYLMVSSKLLLIEQIVFSALTASIGNIIVKEKSEKRYEVFKAMQSASFILCGVITCSFCLLANDLVNVWLGAEYNFDTITIIAITLNTYLACVLQPLWIYRDATGLYIKTKYIMLIGAILNIGLSFGLGYVIGVAGIIFASAIARLSTYFWYEPKLLFKEYFEHSPIKYYLSLFINMGIVAATVFLVSFLTRNFGASYIIDTFHVNGWIALIIEGTVVGSICLVVFLLAYCKSEGFKIIMSKVKNIIKK